ncbi:hypothetical protein [Brevundimonas sp.]|uniref:hypothetical protein n=1 Tax=Brevundimonas sp. TaxID=1871086 RepID=UPI00289A2364|nr:hypothetical protein [Brevundimonas sp.]
MIPAREPIDATDRYIGGRLLARRLGLGLDLAAVADAGALTSRELAAIEAGEAKVYVATLWRLSLALKTDLTDLLPPSPTGVIGRA